MKVLEAEVGIGRLKRRFGPNDFTGYTSQHWHNKNKHRYYTFADLFADSVLIDFFLLRNSRIALSSFRLVFTRVRC